MTSGVDCGGRKLAIFDLETNTGYTFESKRMERNRSLGELALYLLSMKEKVSGPVWVESVPMAGVRNIQTLIMLSQTNGIVHGLLPNTHPVAVSSWKQRTVGSGRAGKDDVRRWLFESHPAVFDACNNNQDLIDAACIALYGEQVRESLDSSGLLSPRRRASTNRRST